ncbi:MAG: DUF5788 family protein [Halovenus sp.]|uniref:DUF5788 family protein n=1 Tax=Halovenus amylolytica TaxID=2500550 RepID=UPI000FE37569
MDDEDRREYISQVQSEGSTVGVKIPETITVGGDELELAEFLIETRKIDRIPPEAKEKITEAKRVLKAERKRRFDRLENEPIDHETAEELVVEINGLDRALNALDTIRRPNYGDESRSAMIEDYKKWLGFLDTVRR